jgi:hypothetical protein
MDATEYARIADLLRQINRKIDQNCEATTAMGNMAVNKLYAQLGNTVRALDHCAWLDERGYL